MTQPVVAMMKMIRAVFRYCDEKLWSGSGRAYKDQLYARRDLSVIRLTMKEKLPAAGRVIISDSDGVPLGGGAADRAMTSLIIVLVRTAGLSRCDPSARSDLFRRHAGHSHTCGVHGRPCRRGSFGTSFGQGCGLVPTVVVISLARTGCHFSGVTKVLR